MLSCFRGGVFCLRGVSQCMSAGRSQSLEWLQSTGLNGSVRRFASQAPELRLYKQKKEIGSVGWFLLLVPISTFALGTWQVQRKKWKEGLIEALTLKTKLPPVDLPADDSELKALEYRKVIVKGTFDHKQEMFLGPRSCLTDGESTANQGKLISSSGTSGYNVVTPFKLSDTNERILVNRGWVPHDRMKARQRPHGQVEGEVELVGIVRVTEPRPPFVPHNKPDVRIWFTRDVEGMAEATDCRNVFIDATADTTVPGGPIGGQTRATLRNEHFSYIITWYSLSAATAMMWYSKFIKPL